MHSRRDPKTRAAPHWTVRSNYRLRVISFAIMFAAIVFHAWDKNYSPLAWCLIALPLLLYPHLTYWRSLHAVQSQNAEHHNLAIDCFLWGVLIAALAFPLWIGFTVYIANTLNITISQGRRGLIKSQVLFLVGGLIAIALFGFQFDPDTNWGATIVCILGNAFYMTAIALTAFGRNQQLRKTRENLKQSEATLKAQIAEIKVLQAKLDEEMEAKVERRTKEQVKNQKLESLGSLVVGIAHEMNTPIGNAMLLASTLDDELRVLNEQCSSGKLRRTDLDSSLQRAEKATKMILNSLDRTAELIRSFKRVSVTRTAQDRCRFCLYTLVMEVVEAQTMAVHGQTVDFRVNMSPEIYLDSYPDALSQALGILIDNAKVHGFDGRSGGVINLVAETLMSGHHRILISDNGKGIAEQDLPKIFDPFFTTRLGLGGNGLGLSVAWNIVTGVLGGSLEVSSELGVGTSFVLSIPVDLRPIES